MGQMSSSDDSLCLEDIDDPGKHTFRQAAARFDFLGTTLAISCDLTVCGCTSQRVSV